MATFEEIKNRGNKVLAVGAMMADLTETNKDNLAVAFLKDLLNQPSTEALWKVFTETSTAKAIDAK